MSFESCRATWFFQYLHAQEHIVSGIANRLSIVPEAPFVSELHAFLLLNQDLHHLPVIVLTAFGTAESLSEAVSNSYGDNQRTNTSLSISLPLYSGNTISARIQKAKIAVNKQESEYLTQLEDLSVQLKDLIDQLQNFNEIIPINETVLESAEEDLKLSQVRYSQGSTTILEVLNAQVSVVQAKSSLVRSKYDAFIQQANLKALLGTLDTEQKNN